MQAEVEIQIVQEIGLQLPDGTEIFPPDTWHGRATSTPEDRQVIVDSLTESAKNLGIDPAEVLLGNYRWIVRDKQIVLSSWYAQAVARSLQDSELLPSPEEPEIIDAQEVPPPDPISGPGMAQV